MEAEASVAEGVVLLGPPGPPGPEQQDVAAGWWVLQGVLVGREPSVAVSLPVTAV